MSNSQGIRKSNSNQKVIKLNKYFPQFTNHHHNVWWFIDGLT